jgi:hypothetical protein
VEAGLDWAITDNILQRGVGRALQKDCNNLNILEI